MNKFYILILLIVSIFLVACWNYDNKTTLNNIHYSKKVSSTWYNINLWRTNTKKIATKNIILKDNPKLIYSSWINNLIKKLKWELMKQ